MADRRLDTNKEAPKGKPEPSQMDIKERQQYENRIAELERQVNELEKENMLDERALTLTQYGDRRELAVIKERVALAPYGATLDERGRAMVAQIAYMLDWNPFFDLHAFPSKGKLCIMPDYKKLLAMVREHTRINYSERPATIEEREQWGVGDGEVAFIVEITEVDTFLDFAKAGAAEHYKPVVGIGIWRKGDNIPGTWTPEMVAGKRALRKALYQLTSFDIVSERFRDALAKAGLTGASEDNDGFMVDLPGNPQIEPGDWWNDSQQRQRFWIELGKLGYSKKSEVASLLHVNVVNVDDSASWLQHMAQFPDLENALAYARACDENNKQSNVIDGEIEEA